MSFSFDTKCEICESATKNNCCKAAKLYGMVLLAQQINNDIIKINTENVLIANLINELANEVVGIYFAIDETSNFYVLSASGSSLKKLYDCLYIETAGRISLEISRVITESRCCAESFLAGAFLVGGYASNPENSYHFEISTPYYNLAKSLSVFMTALGYPVKIVVRKSNYIVYMKDSEAIERFLYKSGAKKSAFAFVDAKIQKEMNNYSNRVNNTKIHNIEKTLNKSVEQVKAIDKIEHNIGLESLESDLVFAARLRKENPDKSLNELVNISDSKFSRSGLNRRLNKLVEIASKLGE